MNENPQWDHMDPKLDFVNESLLAHEHAHSLMDCQWLFSRYSGTVELRLYGL